MFLTDYQIRQNLYLILLNLISSKLDVYRIHLWQLIKNTFLLVLPDNIPSLNKVSL